MAEIADIEKILTAALKANSEIISGDLQGKISTDLPDDFRGEKRLQLFRTDSAPVDAKTEVAHRPIVQVNAFGATRTEANQMASLAFKIIHGLQFSKRSGVWIGRIDTVVGPSWSPDPSTDIPRNIMRFGIETRVTNR